ncbi:RsmB/NOP family class I SAM-dependent RNA methyltransferase [Candidatus Woesearchaeota archaeon]|nr:MAG: RsmB/NOP family class I SAM-dependent RNA methyltransferase [Candidatus Woesearchaeota archaeon]
MNPFVERYQKMESTFNADVTLQSCLRVNTLRTTPQDILARLTSKKVELEKVPYLDFGHFFHADFSLGATPEYLLGYYYLQEAASQLPVQVLQPQAGETVLDMAASPGSKTTQIAQYMQNKGAIIALDNHPMRLNALRNNIERMGVTNTIIFKKDARFAFDLGMQFDKILLDAPCSGNFAKEKKFFELKTVEGARQMARTQKELLTAALKCLKPNGILVYSTCSLEPEENEMNMEWLLKKFSVQLEKINLDIGDEGLTNIFGEELSLEIKKTVRLWPHKTGTEGFFIAKIRKIQ